MSDSSIQPNFDINPLKIVAFASGSGTNFEAIMKAIYSKSLNAQMLVLVYNEADAHVRLRAQEFNVPTIFEDHNDYESRELFEEEIWKQLISNYEDVDLIVLVGWMRIFSDYFISKYPGKIINIHPSFLPEFKGLNAIQQALEAGVSQTGCSTHIVIPELDSGEVIGQVRVPIIEGDNEESLHNRIRAQEHPLLIDTLNIMHQRLYGFN